MAQIHALSRIHLPHQHKIQTIMAMGCFHARYVRRHMHNHQAAAVTLGIGANVAQLAFAKCVATAAMMHLIERILQRPHQLGGTFAIVLQQLVSHALGRLGADVRQHFQSINQAGKSIGRFRHRFQTASECFMESNGSATIIRHNAITRPSETFPAIRQSGKFQTAFLYRPFI